MIYIIIDFVYKPRFELQDAPGIELCQKHGERQSCYRGAIPCRLQLLSTSSSNK
jgi:hypothetical protein